MRWHTVAVLLIFWAAHPESALAQISSDAFPPEGAPYQWSNESGTNDDWGRCSHRDRQSADSILRSCNRILGQRHGGELTAAAYYFRGLEYELLGDAGSARREFENAYRWFTIAMSSDRNNAEARGNRATVLIHLDRGDEAIADYDAALAAIRRSPDADVGNYLVTNSLLGRGEVFFRRGDWTNAIAAFDRAASLNTQSPSAQSLRCEGRAAAGIELDVAEAACERALQLSDQSSYVIFSRGFLRFKRGDFVGAAEDFNSAFEKDNTNSLALYAAGVASIRLGRIRDGDEMISRATNKLSSFDLSYYAAAGLVR